MNKKADLPRPHYAQLTRKIGVFLQSTTDIVNGPWTDVPGGYVEVGPVSAPGSSPPAACRPDQSAIASAGFRSCPSC